MKGHFCWLWSQMHLPTLETSVLPVIQSEIPLQASNEAGFSSTWLVLPPQ